LVEPQFHQWPHMRGNTRHDTALADCPRLITREAVPQTLVIQLKQRVFHLYPCRGGRCSITHYTPNKKAALTADSRAVTRRITSPPPKRLIKSIAARDANPVGRIVSYPLDVVNHGRPPCGLLPMSYEAPGADYPFTSLCSIHQWSPLVG